MIFSYGDDHRIDKLERLILVRKCKRFFNARESEISYSTLCHFCLSYISNIFNAVRNASLYNLCHEKVLIKMCNVSLFVISLS